LNPLFVLKRKTEHICLCFLELPTEEHQLVIRKLWGELGGSSCIMILPKNDFSMNFDRLINSSDSQLYLDSRSILDHYRSKKSKAIFLQSPYLEHYPAWFSSLESDVSFAYAGYGISLSNYFEGQFNAPLIQLCRYLLAASPYEVGGFQRYLEEDSTVLFSGNPLMYELRRAIHDETYSQAQFKPRLLWAPHWSKDWINETQGFAQWRKTIEVVLDFANLNPKIEIVVRPHPILREAILASHFENRETTNRESLKTLDLNSDADQLNNFVKLLNLPNVSMSSNTLLEDVLRASHLVTDGVSIIGYWATTGKPMLVIENQGGSPFNEDGKLIVSTADSAVTAEEISLWLNKANFNSPTPTNVDSQKLSRKIHPTFSKSPVQIFYDLIH
jgi:hypothetical protein